jgi:dihydrofolate reductase
MQHISIIVAVSENGVIGKDNQLLWRLSDDLKQFKKLTTGHCIIMGRKTFESIGKPLPNRTSIIISRQKDFLVENCHVVNSLQKAVELANLLQQNQEIFIIGGGNVYEQALGISTKMYLTEVLTKIDGDTFFSFDKGEWREISRIHHPADERNEYAFDFVELLKIN